jgi:hypothetical protein
MKWDQIESKWAQMTRSIRADFCDERTDATKVVHTPKRRDSVSTRAANSQLSELKEPESKTSVK